jgi:hypothetical protein
VTAAARNFYTALSAAALDDAGENQTSDFEDRKLLRRSLM